MENQLRYWVNGLTVTAHRNNCNLEIAQRWKNIRKDAEGRVFFETLRKQKNL